jgi:hypothetical protein
VVCGDGFARIGDGCALDTVNNLFHFGLLLFGFGFWCWLLWFTPLLYHIFLRLSTPFLKIFLIFFDFSHLCEICTKRAGGVGLENCAKCPNPKSRALATK